jgi:hypothetical protein
MRTLDYQRVIATHPANGHFLARRQEAGACTARMVETLLIFQRLVVAPDGRRYEARACGGPDGYGTWQGWIEFVPLAGGAPLRSPRETTQPNRIDTEYWATGLTYVYLEGALWRALAEPWSATVVRPPSVFNPFPAYRRGEVVLRKQLRAFSTRLLLNVIRAYTLSDEADVVLKRRSALELIDIIATGIRARSKSTRHRT